MPEDPSDERLLREFLAGRDEALEALAGRYERRLLGLALGLLGGDRARAADAVQDTWLRVVKHGRSFRGRSRFGTWIYRIAVNCCRDAAGRPAARPMGTPETRVEPGESAPTDSGDEALATQVRVAVAALTPIQREIVLLCYHDGLTHGTVGEILGIPKGTVKSRLHAALTALRAQLAEEAPA